MNALFPVALAALLAACSPSLNWREVQAEGLAGLLPCRPSHQTRRVPLAGAQVPMTLHACDADGVTWALGSAELASAAQLPAAIDELSAAAQRNVGAGQARSSPWTMQGMTAASSARRLRMAGRRPDGRPVHLDMAVFGVGTRVYQATALGPKLREDALETFFGGLRVTP